MPKEFPPELNHIAPKWFHKRWEDLVDWCHANRPVQGTNVEITDAPGGGKMISASPAGTASGERATIYIAVEGIVYLASVDLEIIE